MHTHRVVPDSQDLQENHWDPVDPGPPLVLDIKQEIVFSKAYLNNRMLKETTVHQPGNPGTPGTPESPFKPGRPLFPGGPLWKREEGG